MCFEVSDGQPSKLGHRRRFEQMGPAVDDVDRLSFVDHGYARPTGLFRSTTGFRCFARIRRFSISTKTENAIAK